MKNKFDKLLELLRADTTPKTVIAKKLGIPYQRIQGWLHKNARPSAEDSEKLLKYYEIKDSPPSEMDAVYSVLIDKIAELMAHKNGTSVTSERLRIEKDVRLLKDASS